LVSNTTRVKIGLRCAAKRMRRTAPAICATGFKTSLTYCGPLL
jgi:hypothetical protein